MPDTSPPHIAGLILARGGSKGIPLKNLAQLGGRPLLSWSLGAMATFAGFDSVWVSTDHPAIASCAAANGAQVRFGDPKQPCKLKPLICPPYFQVFARSAQFATCSAPSVDAVAEFLAQRPEIDIVGLVQCTSPFIRPEFLQKAFRLILEEGTLGHF